MSNKIILLDLMNTVMVDPFYETVNELARTIKRFMLNKNLDSYLKFELGEISEDAYLDNFFQNSNKHPYDLFTPHQFRDTLLAKPFEYIEKAKFFIDEYSNKLDIYLASNYSIWFETHLSRMEAAHRFKGLFVSYQMGVRKPDEKYFEIIKDKTGKGFDEMIFIDDQQANLDAARTLGIQAFDAVEPWPTIIADQLRI